MNIPTAFAIFCICSAVVSQSQPDSLSKIFYCVLVVLGIIQYIEMKRILRELRGRSQEDYTKSIETAR